MIYKDFKGLKLSALGLGCMRFPTLNDEAKTIDEAQVFNMFDYAIENGINYFDTAYGYHNGMSEIVVGKALSRYERSKFYLATKFPGYALDNFNKVEEIFEEQLKKCGVEYFDFYLFHNVNEKNIDKYLDEEIGVLRYLLKQKENGRIKYLGFSSHAEYPTLKRFLDSYGKYMEFCQLQINYIDWTFQRAKEKVDLLNEYNIPVWVMEPLRGGRLAKLDDKTEELLKSLRPDHKTPAWGFRFLQSIPSIKMILSGMSNMDQLDDNINTFKTEDKLNEKELNTLFDIAKKLSCGIPCTTCRYCTEYCPKKLDIPNLIYYYNDAKFMGKVSWRANALADECKPKNCVKCKRCEGVCPQGIQISEVLAELNKLMD